MNYAIIIPVLNPDTKTTAFVDTLLEEGFQNIIVIDDGSNQESQVYFDEIRNHTECTLLCPAFSTPYDVLKFIFVVCISSLILPIAKDSMFLNITITG